MGTHRPPVQVVANVQANLCKAERDKATRALVREVGEEVPLAKVLEGASDWRGRSQQISLLKTKVNELQQAQVRVRTHGVLRSLRQA